MKPPRQTDPRLKDLQRDFLTWKFGMFLHFGLATYNHCPNEWARGYEDPLSFAPTDLDCDQWAEAAVSAGMRYAVFTTKHTGGWSLWQTQTTASHGMRALSNFKDGKGDLVAEFVAACRRHDLKAGLYYCFPRGYGHPEGKPELRGLPPEGRNDPAGFVRAQLAELLTNYGPIDLLWCDQYGHDLGAVWPEILAGIKSLQPDCVVVANNSRDLEKSDVHSYEYPWLRERGLQCLPEEGNAIPAEVCDILGPNWFWRTGVEWTRKRAGDVVDMLHLCNRRNANYLLNVAPDRTGRIPAAGVERLREIGADSRNE